MPSTRPLSVDDVARVALALVHQLCPGANLTGLTIRWVGGELTQTYNRNPPDAPPGESPIRRPPGVPQP